MKMKIKLLILFYFFLTILGCTNESDMTTAIPKLLNSNNFRQFSFDRDYTPSANELSAIHFILKNTRENNIHKMRGETKNVVYVKTQKDEHGYSEAVFDENKQLVTNSYNQGSFNYYLFEIEPIKHFGYDMLPWLEWGNTKDDPTIFNERLFYYTLDLNLGIQAYIFEGTNDNVSTIDFIKLPDEEKMIYRLFCYIIFNKDYQIQLNEENKQRLKEDSEFYYKYFGQIQELLQVNNQKY